jgi:hypothetical protein
MDMITLAMAKAHTDQYFERTEKVLLDVALTDGQYMAASKIGLAEGKTYTVTTDSGTFTSVCKRTSIEDEFGVTEMLTIGNTADFDGVDNGQTYFVMEAIDASYSGALDINGGTHITVVEAATVLAPNHLPGLCLPVVEIANVAAITAVESAALTACIGNPCIIACASDDNRMVFVSNYTFNSNGHQFETIFNTPLVSTDGITWNLYKGT